MNTTPIRSTHRSSSARTFSAALAGCAFALFATLTATPVAAQKLEAYYPLLKDLLDATRNNGPVMLIGNPTPPAQPKAGVCVNGIYSFNTGGQDIRTPTIAKMDPTDFQIDIDFRLTKLPTRNSPVYMMGRGWRWIGIYVQPSGTVGIKYNNSNQMYSQTKLVINRWYSSIVKYKKGQFELVIDRVVVLKATLPVLNWGNRVDQKALTTNDYSNGGAFHGCIRQLRIWTGTALQSLTGTPATISVATGGTHSFALDAGTANASRLYWVFGSVTGTSPGVTLASSAGSVTIPLKPDFWTDLTIALANSALLSKTRGTLDTAGKATAALNVPRIANTSAIGVKFYHAFLVYDAKSNFYMASNPVELTLTK